MLDLNNDIKVFKSNLYHQKVSYWQKKHNKIMPKNLKKKLWKGKYHVELSKDWYK